MKKYLYCSLLLTSIVFSACANKSDTNQDALITKKVSVINVKECSGKSIIETYYTNLNTINSSYSSTDSYTLKLSICKSDSEHIKVEAQDTIVVEGKPKANFTSTKIKLEKCESNDKEDINKLITTDVNRKIALCKRKDDLVDFSLEIKSK